MDCNRYMDLEEARKHLHAKIDKMEETMTTPKTARISRENKQKEQINEEIRHGDFSSFDKLSDEVQNELMSDWDDELQLKYLSREPTMSQEEFYAQLDQIANGTFI